MQDLVNFLSAIWQGLFQLELPFYVWNIHITFADLCWYTLLSGIFVFILSEILSLAGRGD